MLKNTLFLLLIISSLSISAQEKTDSIKVVLDSLAQTQVRCLFEGKAKEFLEFYSKDYIDLGGGEQGDGSVDFEAWEAKLERFIASEHFKKVEGKPIEYSLDIENKDIFSYSEAVELFGEMEKFGFSLAEGDYFFRYPPAKDSPVFDGWIGIFRLKEGVWKVVAGDG
ncbi:MAG: hypothetical protein AB8B69_26100 [Chitinophagales bacterium]